MPVWSAYSVSLGERAVTCDFESLRAVLKTIFGQRQMWSSVIPLSIRYKHTVTGCGITTVMMLVLHTVLTLCPQHYDCCWIGMLYAGVMVPEEEDDQKSAKSKDSRADFMPSLCLNALSWRSHWKWHAGRMIPLIDFSYATRLHRDSITFV